MGQQGAWRRTTAQKDGSCNEPRCQPPEKCPVAAKGWVAPTAMEAVSGATVIEVSVGGAAVTVS
jgi:hypothetical protein